MEAVNSLFLLLTTLASNTLPPDSQTYTPPTEWTTYDLPTEYLGEYDVLTPCMPIIPPIGQLRCPPNSHYKSCGPVCPEFCTQYECPLNCCIEGCFCNEGYVMGYNGSCIRKEHCFDDSSTDSPDQTQGSMYPRECGPNEYIGCMHEDEKNCSDCSDDLTPSGGCTFGCVCIPPAVRGPDGYCRFPEMRAPSSSVSDAALKDWMICNLMRVINPNADCVIPDRECNNYEGCSEDGDENYPSTTSTRGLVSDEMEPCLPNVKTEPVECPPGEVFVECAPICFASCVEYDCPLKCCVSGCYCPEGYVRGPRAVCIPKEECPADNFALSNNIQDTYDPAPVSCGPDEIISCDSHCQLNCSNYYQNEFIPCPDTCVLGCVCKPPKVRGPDGDCIFPEQCHPLPLRQPDKTSKMEMLRNFLRIRENALQQSSMEGPLFKCLKKHERLNLCTYTCPDTCENFQDQSRTCKKVCLPIPRCDCEEGYVRGPSGDCITPEECPELARMPEDCTGLEYYNPCGPACELDCISHHEKNTTCEHKGCRAGCFCKHGMIRDPDGQCVWPFECFVRSAQLLKDHHTAQENIVCPENEEWQSCGTPCPKDCITYDKNVHCTDSCSQGCFCKEPRVRGPDGNCILIEECSKSMNDYGVCPENEEWRVCGTACPKNCTNYDKPIPCIETCSRGCFCKEPLVRGPDGRCISAEECPRTLRVSDTSVCPENEEWKFTCSSCPKNCNNYNDTTPCIPICAAGCFCKEPRVRGPDRRCILPDECPPKLNAIPVCPKKEYYEECQIFCEKNCTSYDQNVPCFTECKSGCVCIPPLVRGPDSTCVYVEECTETKKVQHNLLKSVGQIPAYICKENERFTFCKSVCPDNCNNYKVDRFCKHVCLPGCACLPGYVLSREGVCIKQEHCAEERPEDCSELETYDECGSYCETDCFNFNMASRECHTKECRKGCFCKPGWVRSPDMKCIRPYDCPRRSRIPTRHGGREWPF